MLVKQHDFEQRIIDCLSTDYGIEVVSLTYLPLGADMNASVYKAKAKNQASYFVKLKRGHHHGLGLDVVQLLHKAGIQKIIPSIKTTDGQPLRLMDDFTLIVYPFIEGQNGFTQPLTDEQWLTLGKTLRQVHEIEVPSSILHRLRRETYSPKWREAVRELYIQLETLPLSDPLAQKLARFMKENKLLIDRLVDRADQLAQILQHEAATFVLCHSDIHAGNVLLEGRNNIYLIDWDEPLMAPRERDLMFIGGGVGKVWNKPDEETHFYKGYGAIAINMSILAYYRHERIVEDLALYGQSLFLMTAGSEDRPEMYQQFLLMFEPGGVVDLAFRTDTTIHTG